MEFIIRVFSLVVCLEPLIFRMIVHKSVTIIFKDFLKLRKKKLEICKQIESY